MKLFQNLFKPKWQNTNATIRKQAIIALDVNENQSILKDIATGDEIIDIRLIALKRLTDLETISEVVKLNTETKVKDLGNKLLRQILSGKSESNLNDTQKIEKIGNINDPSLFEYIAENGSTVTLRKAAIEKTERESLLGNLAISDKDASIRGTAAKKLTQKSTLERVFRATKTKDKSISRIVKEKLDVLISEEEKPQKLLAAQKAICLSLENLGNKGLWQRDKIQFDSSLNQWDELVNSTRLEMSAQSTSFDELELQNRFNQAKHKFTQSYDNYLERHKEELEQEAASLPIKQEKQSIIRLLQEQILQLEESNIIDDDRIKEIQQLTTKHESSWKNLSLLPREIENELHAQFSDAVKNIKQNINQRLHSKDLLNSLEKLHKDISYHIKHPFKLSANLVEKFEHQLHSFSISDASHETKELKQRVANILHQASTISSKQQKRLDGLLVDVKSSLETMEEHLSNGVLKEALLIRKSVQSNISEMEKFGVKSLHQIKNRLNSTSARVNELSSWRSWANTPQKQLLIDKVEALIDSNLDPKEIAYIISQTKNEWKKLGPSEKDTSQQLWEKFQLSCDKAYEPCKTFFAEESKIHKENYDKRVTFLETLETFLKQVEWANVDWKQIETLFRHSRQEWQDIGLTDKKKRKGLNDRFYKSYNELKKALAAEWDKNAKFKSDIVEEAKCLADVDDINDAINAAKTLQQRWKKAGRVQHVKERELWSLFKQASDAVFSRRDDLSKEKTLEANKLVEDKTKILEKIEEFCHQSLAIIGKSKSEFKQLQSELTAFGATNSENDTQFEKRLSAALHIYERKLESLEKHNVISDLIKLKEKATICNALELAIENAQTIDVDDFIQQMKKIESPKQNNWNDRINQRFELSINISKKEKPNDAHLIESNKNIEYINQATVQLEIIADVATPKDAAEDRLKAQAQRLSDKLQNRSEENQWDTFLTTEVNWLTIGPVSSDKLTSLSHRHENTISALKTEYSEELKDY